MNYVIVWCVVNNGWHHLIISALGAQLVKEVFVNLEVFALYSSHTPTHSGYLLVWLYSISNFNIFKLAVR